MYVSAVETLSYICPVPRRAPRAVSRKELLALKNVPRAYAARSSWPHGRGAGFWNDPVFQRPRILGLEKQYSILTRICTSEYLVLNRHSLMFVYLKIS